MSESDAGTNPIEDLAVWAAVAARSASFEQATHEFPQRDEAIGALLRLLKAFDHAEADDEAFLHAGWPVVQDWLVNTCLETAGLVDGTGVPDMLAAWREQQAARQGVRGGYPESIAQGSTPGTLPEQRQAQSAGQLSLSPSPSVSKSAADPWRFAMARPHPDRKPRPPKREPADPSHVKRRPRTHAIDVRPRKSARTGPREVERTLSDRVENLIPALKWALGWVCSGHDSKMVAGKAVPPGYREPIGVNELRSLVKRLVAELDLVVPGRPLSACREQLISLQGQGQFSLPLEYRKSRVARPMEIDF